MQCTEENIDDGFIKSIKKASKSRALLTEEMKRTVKAHRDNGKLLSDINGTES